MGETFKMTNRFVCGQWGGPRPYGLGSPLFYQSIFSRYLPALYLLRANSHCLTQAFVVCGKRFKAGKSVVQAFYGKLFWGRS